MSEGEVALALLVGCDVIKRPHVSRNVPTNGEANIIAAGSTVKGTYLALRNWLDCQVYQDSGVCVDPFAENCLLTQY
jgi:hypothetical protein